MGKTLRMDMMYGYAPAGKTKAEGDRRPVYNRTEGVRRSRNTGNRDNSRQMAQRRITEARKRKQKRAQRRMIRWLLLYFCFAGIAATLWVFIGFFMEGDERVYAGGEQIGSGEIAVNEEINAEGESMAAIWDGTAVTPEIRQECQDIYERNESLLLLVNKEHELSASYQPVLRDICKGRLQAAEVLYGDLCAMLEAGGAAGYDYWIASAHRDRSYQQNLVDKDVKKYMAKGYTYEAALQRTHEYTMPAGQSEHETGLALDILCSTNTIMDESQKGEPGNQWLVEHCHEYGFILRYPEEKEDVTKIGFEPWHFRYVGREAAAYLAEKGWTLEEFYKVIGS